jgi:hypothetical protein
VVDLGLVEGKRQTHPFQTKGEAGTFAELKRAERLNEGTAALGLSQDARQDAAKALEVLAPHGITLKQAAECYSKHILAYRDARQGHHPIWPMIPEIAEHLTFGQYRKAE